MPSQWLFDRVGVKAKSVAMEVSSQAASASDSYGTERRLNKADAPGRSPSAALCRLS
jgi:hypothetical protein